MFTLGIDLGKDGGFTLMDSDKILLTFRHMPVHPGDDQIDHYEVEAFFAKCKAITQENHVSLVMEKVGGRAGNAASAMYSFGRNNGYVISLLHSWFHRNIEEVTPRTWQKWLFNHAGIEEMKDAKDKRDTKRMATDAICKLYPNHDFRKTKRSIKAHSGIIDSAGIALWKVCNA